MCQWSEVCPGMDSLYNRDGGTPTHMLCMHHVSLPCDSLTSITQRLQMSHLSLKPSEKIKCDTFKNQFEKDIDLFLLQYWLHFVKYACNGTTGIIH